MFGQRQNCRIDEAEPQGLILHVQFQNPGVAFLWKVHDKERLVGKTFVKESLSATSETFAQEVVDFWKDGSRDDELTDFRLNELA